MKRQFIPFILVMLFATLLSSLSKANDNAVEHYEQRRTLFSGERRNIYFAYHIADDCSMYSLPNVQILKPPRHGKMVPIPEEDYPRERDEYEKCNTTKVLGLAAYYTPEQGFSGRDSFTTRFSYGNGIVEIAFDIEVVEKPKLDPTCNAVNQAYVATRNSPKYKDRIYELREDGTRALVAVIGGDPEKFAELNLQTGRWSAYDKAPILRLEDREYPKFSSCRLLDRQRTTEGKVAHYSVIWRKFPYRAESEVWISADTGLFLKTLRRYPDNG